MKTKAKAGLGLTYGSFCSPRISIFRLWRVCSQGIITREFTLSVDDVKELNGFKCELRFEDDKYTDLPPKIAAEMNVLSRGNYLKCRSNCVGSLVKKEATMFRHCLMAAFAIMACHCMSALAEKDAEPAGKLTNVVAEGVGLTVDDARKDGFAARFARWSAR